MHLLISPLPPAPLASGHPQPVQDTGKDLTGQAEIKPIADARNPDARMKEGQAPTQFWSAVNGEPDRSDHHAPPSIMQITITRLLDEQSPDSPDRDTGGSLAPVTQTHA